jgi:streptomycin 6-kinase
MNQADVEAARLTAQTLEREWHLTLGEILPGATCSLVVDAGDERVLKIPFPFAEEASSHHAVQAFEGHGGVSLLKHDARTGGMLMPRIRPGYNLYEARLSDMETVDICADLILRLRNAPLSSGISLSRWHRSVSTLPDSPLVREARNVLVDLQNDPPEPILLHGDLHHFNILRHGDEWQAIDPKGLIGDPSFEVVGFMRNPINAPPDAIGMRRRLERFAKRLSDPLERLWGWSFVETVSCSASPGGFDWGNAAQAIWDARPQ